MLFNAKFRIWESPVLPLIKGTQRTSYCTKLTVTFDVTEGLTLIKFLLVSFFLLLVSFLPERQNSVFSYLIRYLSILALCNY